jgi:hypothetical protein
MVPLRQGNSAVAPLGSRLHHAADVFDRFIDSYPVGPQPSQNAEVGDRVLLQARIVDLRTSLVMLADTELSAWPDEEFIVMIRTPRNSAMDQVIELRNLLAQDANADAELYRFISSLAQIRRLIRERVPLPKLGRSPAQIIANRRRLRFECLQFRNVLPTPPH